MKSKITNTTKRTRLINMRECLYKALPMLSIYGSRETAKFICHAIDMTDCDEVTKQDTRNLVMGSLDGRATLNGWLSDRHEGRYFNERQMYGHRRRWVKQLCRFLSIEIGKLDEPRKHYLPFF